MALVRLYVLFGMLLLIVLIQWMLNDIKFSTPKAEWIFRLMYLTASALSLWAAHCIGAVDRGSSLLTAWSGALPMLLVTILFWLAIHDADAQGAISFLCCRFFMYF